MNASALVRRIYVTHHSEYHCVDDVCVGVRNRVTGECSPHPAMGQRLRIVVTSAGTARIGPDGVTLGDRLCFGAPGVFVRTGTVLAVVEPNGWREAGA